MCIMKFELKKFNRDIPDEELLDDIRRVVGSLGVESVSSRDYNEKGGKYTASTIGSRFGSWNSALLKAGLQLVHHREVGEKDLFENLENLWIKIGRQPTLRDMKKPNSRYSAHQYVARFGTWRTALQEFVNYVNSGSSIKINENTESLNESTINEVVEYKHKTKRNPSEKLKVQVLMRDGNKCRLCGITVIGSSIHFDHIKPWSKGGETVLENLQVLCDKHNLAKGNLEY